MTSVFGGVEERRSGGMATVTSEGTDGMETGVSGGAEERSHGDRHIRGGLKQRPVRQRSEGAVTWSGSGVAGWRMGGYECRAATYDRPASGSSTAGTWKAVEDLGLSQGRVVAVVVPAE